jgi:glutathione S-transferase
MRPGSPWRTMCWVWRARLVTSGNSFYDQPRSQAWMGRLPRAAAATIRAPQDIPNILPF